MPDGYYNVCRNTPGCAAIPLLICAQRGHTSRNELSNSTWAYMLQLIAQFNVGIQAAEASSAVLKTFLEICSLPVHVHSGWCVCMQEVNSCCRFRECIQMAVKCNEANNYGRCWTQVDGNATACMTNIEAVRVCIPLHLIVHAAHLRQVRWTEKCIYRYV